MEGLRQPEHPERCWTRGLRWSKARYLEAHLPRPSKEGGEYEREKIQKFQGRGRRGAPWREAPWARHQSCYSGLPEGQLYKYLDPWPFLTSPSSQVSRPSRFRNGMKGRQKEFLSVFRAGPFQQST